MNKIKKILVTGGCGFIGSNLVEKLISKKYTVYCVDNKLKNKVKGCCYYKNNILKNIKIKDVDCIIHLAALARIQPSFNNPEEYWHNNCEGTFQVVNYAKNKNIPIIYAGSSSNHGGRFLNPYTFTKDIGEDIIRLYQKCYNLKSTIVRFYNVYGPKESIEKNYATLIGKWKHNYYNNEPLVIFGNGKKKRDFTHVDDINDAIIKILKKQAFGYTFELGRGKSYSVNDIFKLFNYKKVRYESDKPGEVKNTKCDNKLAKKILNWEPKKNIEDYIKQIKKNKL